MRRLVFQQTKTNGLPYAYIGVVFGVNVSIHGSPMECLGLGKGTSCCKDVVAAVAVAAKEPEQERLFFHSESCRFRL